MPKKGYKQTEEHSEKVRNINRGKKRTEEWKIRQSKMMKGNKYALGVKHTEEWKIQQSEIMKKYSKENNPKHLFKKGHTPWSKGKKLIGWKPWSYIDGRSKTKGPDRYGDDWDKIRMLIYKRDNYQCQHCNMTMNELGKPLDIHHKIPFLISFDNSLNNLIALCRSCHRQEEARIMRELKNIKMEVKIPWSVT